MSGTPEDGNLDNVDPHRAPSASPRANPSSTAPPPAEPAFAASPRADPASSAPPRADSAPSAPPRADPASSAPPRANSAPSASPRERVEIDGIRWRAGGRAILDGVTFAVRAGEVVAMMGRNGAGKSTLLDIIAGLRRAHAGEVRVDGRPLSRWSAGARARTIAHLPQSVRADLPFAARELVLMGRYPHTDRWFEGDADRAHVEDAMSRTDCWHIRDRLVATLSGGERQRVLLAACLAQSAPILLLDEPSTHLDLDQQLHCFSLLRDEGARGTACLAVTHDLNLALAFATRLVVIADGRVALDVPVDEATRSSDWLALFSSRLTMTVGPSGRALVSYA